MKLSEVKPLPFLIEKLLAPVHVNDEQTLTVIANLVKKEFNVRAHPYGFGICLFSQFLYSLEASTGIPVSKLQAAYSFKNQKDDGHTPGEIIDHFNKATINYQGYAYKLKIGFEQYSIDEVVSIISKGQPVILIVDVNNSFYDDLSSIQSDEGVASIRKGPDGKIYGWVRNKSGTRIRIDKEDINDVAKDDKFVDKGGYYVQYGKDGTIKSLDHYKVQLKEPGEIMNVSDTLTKSADTNFHALLIIGYDSANDFLIGRDSRSRYGYKGFFKVKKKLLKQNEKAFNFFGFTVEDMKKTKIEKTETPEKDNSEKNEIFITNA